MLFFDARMVCGRDPLTMGVCADLVRGYRDAVPLGILERHTLRECVKWRAVANVTIAMFGLAGVPDTALLSFPRMLAAVLGHAAAVGVSHFVRDPWVYLDAATYVLLQNEDSGTSIVLGLNRFRSVVARFWNWFLAVSARFVAAAPSDAASVPLPPSSLALQLWPTRDNFTSVRARVAEPTRVVRGNRTVQAAQTARVVRAESKARADAATVMQAVLAGLVPPAQRTHGRHLLAAAGQPDAQSRRAGWPQDWVEFVKTREPELLTCELYDIASYSIETAYTAMEEYHENGFIPRNNTNASIRDNLMRTSQRDPEYELQRNSLFSDTRAREDSKNFGVYVVDAVMDLVLQLAGVSVEDVLNFFDPVPPLEQQIRDDLFTFPRLVYDLSHCDLHRVMRCDATPKNLFSVVVICTVMLYVLVRLIPFLPDGASTFAFVVILPWFVMWYAYGYSPACFPMIPTCFGSDMFDLVNASLPSQILWPALLIKQDVCTREGVPYNTSLTPASFNCFKSCASDEFRFRGWEDALAWIVCDIDVRVCERLGKWAAAQTSLAASYNDTTAYFVQVLAYNNEHLTVAHRLCGFITVARSCSSHAPQAQINTHIHTHIYTCTHAQCGFSLRVGWLLAGVCGGAGILHHPCSIHRSVGRRDARCAGESLRRALLPHSALCSQCAQSRQPRRGHARGICYGCW